MRKKFEGEENTRKGPQTEGEPPIARKGGNLPGSDKLTTNRRGTGPKLRKEPLGKSTMYPGWPNVKGNDVTRDRPL